MLKLIGYEFAKLRRRRVLWLVAFAACLFPVPVSLVTLRSGATGGSFDSMLLILMAWLGVPLMLPALMGIVASSLFRTERACGALKNLYAIPVRWARLALAKIVVVLALSVAFTAATFMAAALATAAAGGALHGFGLRLCAAVLVGLFYGALSLPGVLLAIWLDRNALFSNLLAVLYAVVLETMVWSAVTALSSSGGRVPNLNAPALSSPPALIFRWFPYFINPASAIQTELDRLFFVPLWQVAPVCGVVAAASTALIVLVGSRREV